MRIPLSKLKAMILFFGSYTDKRFLGKAKLMKLFYFADFCHLKKYGSPITWDTYINLEHGPIPSGIKNLVDDSEDLDASKLLDTIKIEKDEGVYLHRIVPSRDFSEDDKKYFSETEISIMKDVCARFFDKNAREIEGASHKESAWKETSFLDAIPYSMATKDEDCRVSKEEIDLMVKIFN